MKTIKEVFAQNMRAYRGDRTQAEMAELARLPLRTYQNLEQGFTLPQDQTIEALANAYGVPQTRLFLDSDLTRPSPVQALEVLADFVESARAIQTATSPIPEDIQELVVGFGPKDWAEVRRAIEGVIGGKELLSAKKAQKNRKTTA